MITQLFYQNADGQQFGPIDSKELCRLARAGIVKPDTLIRQSGSANWVLAERVQGLFNRITLPPSSSEVPPPPIQSRSTGSRPPLVSPTSNEKSISPRPLGNLTYEEASRYFTEYCELLEHGCGMREPESSLPTSFDRMKEALKVECLNRCAHGGDFDESCDFIGAGYMMLSRFVPVELAIKLPGKMGDGSNIEAIRSHHIVFRAANEFVERRTNELSIEWNDFRKKHRTGQTPKSLSLFNPAQSQQPKKQQAASLIPLEPGYFKHSSRTPIHTSFGAISITEDYIRIAYTPDWCMPAALSVYGALTVLVAPIAVIGGAGGFLICVVVYSLLTLFSTQRYEYPLRSARLVIDRTNKRIALYRNKQGRELVFGFAYASDDESELAQLNARQADGEILKGSKLNFYLIGFAIYIGGVVLSLVIH